MQTLVLSPTYNEAANVIPLVTSSVGVDRTLDLLIIDDNSPDGTADVVKSQAALYPGRVHLIERPGKAGYGKACIAGLIWAAQQQRYDAVVTLDADGSHDPANIQKLLTGLDHGDVVIGSRYVPGGGSSGQSNHRIAISQLANGYARTVTRCPAHDMTSGYRAYSSKILHSINWSQIGASGFSFLVEGLTVAHRSGARIKEVPITYRQRAAGDSKMSMAIASEGLSVVWKLRSWKPQAHHLYTKLAPTTTPVIY